ncbi:MAG TPA: membrane-bound O-acyltransferase family protein [Verrucomicrobia bacterium]|nr:MAG: alginate O-acetyltransferase [Lentisphaerae bacterium GWF2_57_35]HBA86082.1 membrane-bound O-acyltransferase family protein [Verrucomicrobiota bacterium]
MLFNSDIFIFVFLPVVLLGFFLLGQAKTHEPAMGWLAAASLVYYGWWNPRYLPLLLLSIGVNYAVGYALVRFPAERKAVRRSLFAAGMIFNLGLLGYYKYAGFFVQNLNEAFQTDWSVGTIILPLAISFFTFQQMAYLVDAWRGETKEYNFLHYTLFVAYFPQLIAGPIVHHKEMLPQFGNRETYRLNARNLAIGFTMFGLGLAKKVLLADNVSVYASPMFSAAAGGQAPDFFTAWGGVLAYTFQIYFDFSGYSDMAIGLGKMCGIDLPLNFNSPYKATGIIEFWKRWHITLSRFLRDYLYIPLGGSRRGAVRRYVNLFVTMLLGGLWHGAGWTFVLWGALHGVYLIVNHAWRHVCGDPTSPAIRAVSSGVTFLAVLAGWVLFRAVDVESAGRIYRGLLGLNGWQGAGLGWGAWVFLIGLMGVVWVCPNSQEWMGAYLQAGPALPAKTFRWRPSLAWAAGVALLAGLALVRLSVSRVTEFLYFQF